MAQLRIVWNRYAQTSFRKSDVQTLLVALKKSQALERASNLATLKGHTEVSHKMPKSRSKVLAMHWPAS
jgi:hypothetical protein